MALGHRSAGRSRDRPPRLPGHAHRAPAGRGPAAARRRRPRAPARARRRGRAPRAALGRVPGRDHGRRSRPTSTRPRWPPPRAAPGEAWFCFEQPDRDRFALATLGCAAALDDRGAAALRARRGALARAAGRARRGDGRRGAGGRRRLRLRPRRRRRAALGRASQPASLHVPEVALARRGERGAADAGRRRRAPTTTPTRSPRALEARAAALRSAPLPLLDPDPTGRYRVVSAMPPEHYESAVARAVERIRAGALDKVVLAREVQVHAPRAARRRGGPRRPARGVPVVLHLLRGPGRRARSSPPAPSCSCAATACAPGTLALAGSTRRSADPAVDDHLGEQLLRSDKDREEQAIVTRRIVRALRPRERLGDGGRGAGRRADGQHPAPGDADPRAARAAGQRGRARRAAAPDAGRRRRAVRRRRAAHPRARGPRPRLVRGAGGVDGRQRGRRVLRRAALRAARRARWRAATRASASCATPTRRPSWPRPRSSSQALLPVLAG